MIFPLRVNVIGLACAVMLCGPALADCYTVHGSDGAVLFRDSVSPVDLRFPLRDTVPLRFGAGAVLVMVPDSGECLKAGAAGGEQPFSGERWAHLEWGMPTEVEGNIRDGGVLSYGGSVVSVPGRLGYPYTGPRGGVYRYSSGGNRVYQPRGR